MHATVNTVILGVQRWLMLLVPLVVFFIFSHPLFIPIEVVASLLNVCLYLYVYIPYIKCVAMYTYDVWHGMLMHSIA